ncbi:glutamate formimidoyltransferase [Taibaiella koreensis]|uniref:glutamate formimidoyltransferase n=1 Tax=Taibaiella koreensis TaxID=1268548 RepID=UPI000E59E940|nr:glutamate formimidoyltransferase [Taibaiella koreensis]
MKPLLECVPNFSEGNDLNVIDRIREAIVAVPGQKLLHIDPSPSANRTVFTFAGQPEAVAEAAFRAIETAGRLIDMRRQQGAHPRIGATDVCPLIPLGGLETAVALSLAEQLGQRVGDELDIPVYLYEQSAKTDYRRALPDIRKGGYEGLQAKMKQAEWQPDYGPSTPQGWGQISRTGATVIGARNVLVAFNISLDTRDAGIAADIARQMRSRNKGLLPMLRAIGWYMADFDCAQVSMNLLDYRITSPLTVWDTCKALAAAYGVVPTGCEVVGLIPEACVLEAGAAALGKAIAETSREQVVAAGIGYLKLDGVKPFAPREKILEYVLEGVGLF